MNNSPASNTRNAARAQRALGAMFFFPFGGVWLGVWAYYVFAARWLPAICVAIVSAALLALAYRVYQTNAAPESAKETPEEKRDSFWFNVINLGQWALIFIVAFTLRKFGLASWTIASIIFIVGLHFLPLARLFANPAHYLAGFVMMVWALLYPFISSGPSNPIGCLGAGLILWASAAWAISQ